MDVHPIRTEADYEAALAEIERLFDAAPDTPAGDRLEVLATLVEAYEEQHYSIPAPDPIEAIKYYMESRGLCRRDLEPHQENPARAPARENHPRMPDPRAWEPRTVSRRWNAVSAPSLRARQGGGHRGRRPDHGDQGRTRERVSASSASCLESAEQCGATCSAGSPLRDQSSPPARPAAPPGRSIHPKRRGRQGRRDKREREGTLEGREAV